MRTSRRSFGHQYLAPAAAWVAVLVCLSASPSAALADCGPGARSWCRCVYVELPPELSHLRHLWQPVVTIPGELTPVEPISGIESAGTLELNLPMMFPSPNTFLVASEVPDPIFVSPPSIETFVIHTLSPVTLPTFTTLNLSQTILPTTPWAPSGVLEHNATLTVILPDMSYILPTVPEPSAALLALVAAPWLLLRRRSK